MHIHQLLVLSNPAPGREDAYNRWYDEIHLPEVLQVPGVVSAQRFAAAPGEAWAYTAIYDMETDDPQGVVNEIMARSADGRIAMSDAIDMGSVKMLVTTPRGSRLSA